MAELHPGNKELVVVVGATGMQGGSVVDALLKDGNYLVRGLTRDVTTDKAKALMAKNCEVMECDMADPANLQRAFHGAYAVYALTDFYAKDVQQKWNAEHINLEEQYGKNMVDAAKINGVRIFVWSSLINARDVSRGKYEVTHFTAKNEVEKYARAQGLPLISFYPGFFMSNMTSWFKPRKAPDGVTEISLGLNPGVKLPMIAVEEDVGKFVTYLINHHREFIGRQIYAATYYTPEEIVDGYSRATGEKARFIRTPDDVVKGQVGDELAEMFRFFNEYGYYNNADLRVHGNDTIPLTSWESYVSSHKEALTS